MAKATDISVTDHSGDTLLFKAHEENETTGLNYREQSNANPALWPQLTFNRRKATKPGNANVQICIVEVPYLDTLSGVPVRRTVKMQLQMFAVEGAPIGIRQDARAILRNTLASSLTDQVDFFDLGAGFVG